MTLTENKLREVLDVNATLLDRLAATSSDPVSGWRSGSGSAELLRAQRVVSGAHTHDLASRLPPLPPSLRSAATYESSASASAAATGSSTRAPPPPPLSLATTTSSAPGAVHPVDRLGALGEAPSLRAAAAVQALQATSARETLRTLDLITSNGASEKPFLINGGGPSHSAAVSIVSSTQSAAVGLSAIGLNEPSANRDDVLLGRESTTSSRLQSVKRTLAAVQTTLGSALESRVVSSVGSGTGISATVDPDDSL